ncbi:hypothetical protein KIN20_024268 [Parelaphostrongylus tenuis]|uniref:Uncharacterized protein n=1 Tax=Parelaphostrongylus tenuis TaxID=148309 RepID=A0AAD5MT70_PARTN|nr:hypothetical protein KIN20_024268 [Parelaphostrongylus tenuis]
MTDGREQQWGQVRENKSSHLEDYSNDGWTCLLLTSTVCIHKWQRVWIHGMGLAYVTVLEADRHYGQQLRERETNGNCARAHTTSEDGPLKISR